MYIIEHSQIQQLVFLYSCLSSFTRKKIVIVPKKIVYLQYVRTYNWNIPGNIYLKYPWQFLPEVSLKIFTWSIPGQIYLHFPGNIRYLTEESLEMYNWSFPESIYLKYPCKYLSEVARKKFTWSIPGNFYLKYPWKTLEPRTQTSPWNHAK